MSYTKNELIEQVYIRLSGGKLTQESTVKRIDLHFYVLAAVHAAWGLEFQERAQTALRAKRGGMAYDSSVFNDLQVSEVLTPVKDTENGLFYIKPNSVITIGGKADWDIASVKGFEKIFKIGRRSELQGISDTSIMYAYYERTPEKRIYLINTPPTCKVEFTSIQDLSKIGGDEIMPLPEDKAVLVIDKAVEFFTGQKQALEDVLVDQNDASNEREQKL